MKAHAHRGQITVDLAGAWRRYANHIPLGGEPIGTVTTARGETGALIWIERTGIYVRLNAGAMVALPQRKVQAAIDAARIGRDGQTHVP